MDVHNPEYFMKHCEIVALLVARDDRDHPSVKHHIRSAVREASNHVGFGPGNAKQSAKYMSRAAKESLESGDRTNLVAEHIVPVSVLNERVLNIENPTKEKIAKFLYKYGIRAVITKKEDKHLDLLGLNKKMPETAKDDQLFARYDYAGIDLVENRYSELVRSILHNK